MYRVSSFIHFCLQTVCSRSSETQRWQVDVANFDIYLSRVWFVHEGDFAGHSCPLEFSLQRLLVLLLLEFFPL